MLAVTTPGGYPWNNLPPVFGMLSLARLTFTPEVEKKVPTVMPMIYTSKWLAEKAEGDSRGRTNYQIESEVGETSYHLRRLFAHFFTGIYPPFDYHPKTTIHGSFFSNGRRPDAPRPTRTIVPHLGADTQGDYRDR